MSRDKSMMLYTPEQHIPIGECILTSSGEYALRIKKSGCNEYEVVSIGQLMTMLARTMERSRASV